MVTWPCSWDLWQHRTSWQEGRQRRPSHLTAARQEGKREGLTPVCPSRTPVTNVLPPGRSHYLPGCHRVASRTSEDPLHKRTRCHKQSFVFFFFLRAINMGKADEFKRLIIYFVCKYTHTWITVCSLTTLQGGPHPHFTDEECEDGAQSLQIAQLAPAPELLSTFTVHIFESSCLPPEELSFSEHTT